MTCYESEYRMASLERAIESLQQQLSTVKAEQMKRQKRDDSILTSHIQSMVKAQISAYYKGPEFASIIANKIRLPLMDEMFAIENRFTEALTKTAQQSANNAETATAILRLSASSAVDFLCGNSCRFAKG